MMAPLRIAVLSLHRGGMAHYAAGLANAVRLARPDASVACFCPGDVEPDLFDPMVTLFRYAVPQELSWRGVGGLVTLPLLARRIRKELLKWNPSILHVNSGHVSYPLFVPRLAARIPTVSTLHDIHPHLGERRPVERIKISALLRYSRRIIVNGQWLKDQAVECWRLAPERVEVFPVIMSSRIREWAGAPDEDPNEILMFGRIHEYKGLGVMLNALPRIVQRIPRARLVIAGQGSLERWTALFAPWRARLEIHNRFIPDREMPGFFRRCAVVAMPYLEASQSGVEPIAACFEKAVVGTRTGALPEAIEHGKTGLLVEPGDPAALAGALMTLLGDPELRRRMGRRAFEQRYGPGIEKALGERLCRLYEECIRYTSVADG
ncbi:MAG: glycosyltransferase family 4 protein [Verrucomicrobia bacterium]|nr:glycosyltransferase family 4 protein [Verrucomicrobiota bacterium]MBU1909441.1 glycosyltransferase family 4 protein [Verrucomicrobiota bacterium]